MMPFPFFRAKCAICGKKASQPRKYLNAEGKPVKVCALCVPYAERRAFRRR
jgi:ribosome-binding protein aMBF1 (putative translation factor)